MTGGKKEKSDGARGRYGFWMWIILLLALAMAVSLLAVSCGRDAVERTPVAASKNVRRPLPDGLVRESAYFTDKLGWLSENEGEATRGMAYFYEQTGVQPHLYLTTQIGGIPHPTMEDMQSYAELLYDGLFNDQAHVLLLVCVADEAKQEYLSWCVSGSAAESVVDEEARMLLREYWDAAYHSTSLAGEGQKGRMVAGVFRDTANNIMHVKNAGGWITLLILILAAMLLIILFDLARAAARARRREGKSEKA